MSGADGIDFVCALSLLLAPPQPERQHQIAAPPLQFASDLNTFEFLENSSRFNQERGLFCLIPYSSIQMKPLIQYIYKISMYVGKMSMRAHDVTQAIIPLTRARLISSTFTAAMPVRAAPERERGV